MKSGLFGIFKILSRCAEGELASLPRADILTYIYNGAKDAEYLTLTTILKERFGKYFDYAKFSHASEKVDEKLGEDPEVFRARGRELYEQIKAEKDIEMPHVKLENSHRER